MRVGIWNQGEYAGFPEDPQKQIDWFLDTAERVKAQRIAAGKSIDDPSQFGEWIADTERPAEQYRGRYQLRLDEARGLLSKASAAPDAAAAPVAPVAGAPVAAPAPAGGGAVVEAAAGAPAGSHAPIDPAQFGGEGTGGPPDAEMQALLQNKNVVLDSTGIADIKAGRIDPRVVAVLTKLSHEHKITVSCMCSDHPKFTTGGSISNHHHGRGLDIAAVDGVPVNSSNFDAREIATELQSFDGDIRPNEIGSPWAIAGPGYFTDAGHQDHLHVGFKDPIDPNWKPPAEVAATGAPGVAAAPVPGAPAVAGVAPVPVAGAPGAAPVRQPGDSIAFAAVSADQAAKAAASTPGAAKARSGDSLAFMQAVGQPQAPAAAPGAVAAAADAGVAFAGAPDAYPGDNATKEQLAAWLAEQARKRGLPPELPVMASLVESGLQNLSGGDADSAGFFQMRIGIWDKDQYAGFRQDPQKQAAWFLDTAERVKAQRIARGQSVDDPSQFGEWIADVERPAEQYRGRYQLRLDEAKGLLARAPAPPAAGVAPVPGVPAVDPTAGGSGAAVDAAATAAGGGAGPRALAAVAEAKKYLGTPYQWGGSTPETNFDCSGLMQWAYSKAGLQISRTTYTQIEAPGGVAVDRQHLRPGDLIFFASPSGDVHHVAMSLGGDEFIHAPSTGDVVKISSLKEPYFAGQFHAGRRFDNSVPVMGAAAPGVAAAAPGVAAVPGVAAAVPGAPALEVAQALAAVARDAAEVRRHDSILFKAITAQEASKHRATVQFMKAVDPNTKPGGTAAAAGGGAPAAVPPEAAPVAVPPEVAPAVAAVPPEASANTADAGPPVDLSGVDLGDYPGDNAPKEELAKWMAKQAEKAGLPPELPVMASLVESGVANLSGGDADSAGFFQMRVGIWDRGPYAGYRQNPKLQVKWFIDNALTVRKQRLAAGKPIDDPGAFGEWIADIERPAAQYRYRYQLRLSEARKLLRD
jgi:cell wall-associated NlpC family hydrolase